MHNFGVSTALRGWFDYVLRAGETFTYSDSGPKGLLSGKQVIVIETRGGIYEGEDKELDFQEPYVRLLFGFIGLTDVTFVHAEKLGFGPEAVEEAVLAAKRSIASITATVQSATV
jgi:FMN-dependent NADH-azoreductase